MLIMADSFFFAYNYRVGPAVYLTREQSKYPGPLLLNKLALILKDLGILASRCVYSHKSHARVFSHVKSMLFYYKLLYSWKH